MTTTIETLLAAAAGDAADVPALMCEGESVTYAELHARVREGAAAWIAHGLRPGDRVACWAANTIDCTVAMLSAIVAGGVLVPLNPRYTSAEVAAILPRVSAPFLVAPGLLAGRRLAAEALPIAGGAQVIALGPDVPEGAVGWDEFRAGAGAAARVEPGEIIAIQFTSGTTGRPKGAVLRQEPFLTTARTWAEVVGLGRGDVYPVTYPLAHIGGFKTGLISPFQVRATAVLIPVVSAESIAEVVRTLPVAVLNAPPAAQRYVVAARRNGDIPGEPAIRVAVIGSAIVPPALVRDLKQELGVGDVVIGYGLTEATGVCTMTRPGDPLDLVCDTIGRPIDGVRARVWAPDATGSPVVGEIEVTGSNVMAGYLDDPAATAEVMRDGWLRTGDLGWIGEDGYVRIAGRTRDMVIVGGFNVYPAEVEHVLADHPSVTDAAVVGVPDDRLGEVTAAFVVVSGELDESELLAWCRERLANFKVPRRVWILDELPRGAVGKIAKPRLQELAVDLLRRPG
ncbi:AMP-binding protein [Nonomuraea harbinensis]|uniref:AMP-binding protein n=1 Tax=Nonomuraea harbinensis TaxID=1286938 RepID=A0ABW1BKU7_9ACTN|nr:AMP-binding protein [Nonomuraea harbinensis]